MTQETKKEYWLVKTLVEYGKYELVAWDREPPVRGSIHVVTVEKGENIGCIDGEYKSGYRCPSCHIPIMVGKYSIKLDKEQIEKNKITKILAVAKQLIDTHNQTEDDETLDAAINKLARALEE